ncbi:uncharacterized protein [Panulirus ornatus]|uniref:uncharacterized protein n=1 Tax=Panulirus ornatus TaxID=150431 RepID=UPI003A89E446
MVFGVQPECIKCKASVSNLWRKDDKDQVLCTECYNMAHVINPKLTPVRTSKDREEDEQDVKKEEDKLEADDIKDADSSNGNGGRDDDQDGDKDKDLGKGLEKRETKRKTRKGRQGGKGSIPKGKGRRYIFKKSVLKKTSLVS